MENSKVKNVIIVILLAVNLALGGLLIRNTTGAQSLKHAAFEDLKAVLKNNGIELRIDALPSAENVFAYTAKRNETAEAEIAKQFINECIVDDQGGNIYYYHSGDGSMRFRSGGDFEAEFESPVDGAKVKNVLSQYSINIEITQNGEVEASQVLNGYEIVNCKVEAEFEEGNVISLRGRWLLSETETDYTMQAMDATTAMMRFVGIIEKHGIICTEISELSLGYSMSAQVSGLFELIPVWRVVTDTGEYQVNAVTGTVERIQSD